MKVVFKPIAWKEFFEAIAWYEDQRAGLGKDFGHEVVDVLKRARLHPELFPKVRGRARKIRLQRFSAYSIYFAVKDDSFSVMAVFHGSRDPKDLLQRLD